jgi:hypothetical protein
VTFALEALLDDFVDARPVEIFEAGAFEVQVGGNDELLLARMSGSDARFERRNRCASFVAKYVE